MEKRLINRMERLNSSLSYSPANSSTAFKRSGKFGDRACFLLPFLLYAREAEREVEWLQTAWKCRLLDWQDGCARLETGYMNGLDGCTDAAVLPLSTLHGCSPGFHQSLPSAGRGLRPLWGLLATPWWSEGANSKEWFRKGYRRM